MRKSTLLLIAIAAIAFALTSADRANAGEPTPTTDLVIVGLESSYTFGETASISLRNDGDVPYDLGLQPNCAIQLEDADTGREFRAPENTHCDVIGVNLLNPGETELIMTWSLYECTAPGFFCFDSRPLETGDYIMSGSYLSEDGTLRAEFSQTFSVIGPTFRDDIVLSFEANGQPSTHGSAEVSIKLTNQGQVRYTVLSEYGCFLDVVGPEDDLFIPPPFGGLSNCGPDENTALAPGASVTVVSAWALDQCVEFDQNGCARRMGLSPGIYTFSGAIESPDVPYYSEFEATYTIDGPTPVPSPTPAMTPGDFPPTGGPASGGGGGMSAAFVIAALGAVALSAGWVTRRVARG